MKFFRKMDNLCGMITKAERITAAVILLVMFIICFMAVILRYVFNSPWTWSDEVILIMLVAFGYLCISIDVYNDEHVALTGIYNRLPPTAKKVLDDAMDYCMDRNITDWGRIKTEIKEGLGEFVWKKTKRRPMIMPIIMEV